MLVGGDVPDDASQEQRLLCSNADISRSNAGRREKASKPLRIGGNEGEGGNGDALGPIPRRL